MAYNDTIPQPSDVLSNSQVDILENFSQLNSQFGVDHSPFDPSGANGKHAKVTLPEIGGAPGSSANEGVYYTKAGPSETEPWFQTESSGFEYPLWMPVAYVYFTGSTGAIIKAYNVSSVTRSSAGTYVINITAGVMANTGYVALPSMKSTPGNEGASMHENASVARTATTFPCICATSGVAIFDPSTASVVFFGGRR